MRFLIPLILCLSAQCFAAEAKTPPAVVDINEPVQSFDLDVGSQGNIELAASDVLNLLNAKLPNGFKILSTTKHVERLEKTNIVFYTLLIEADVAGAYDFAFEFANDKGVIESRVPFHSRIKGINER
jgi:hypothetical protein